MILAIQNKNLFPYDIIIELKAREMMIMLIACTKTAARALKRKVTVNEIDEDSFYCWHVKLFSVTEGKLLLFMNELTRLPLFIPLESRSNATVEERFLALIKAVILHMGYDKSVVEAYLKDGELVYTKAFNLSITSQMNALCRVYQCEALYGSQYCKRELEAVIKYAEIPCFKYNIYPYQAFQSELFKRFK